jgi:hypothetical protein
MVAVWAQHCGAVGTGKTPFDNVSNVKLLLSISFKIMICRRIKQSLICRQASVDVRYPTAVYR